MNLSRKPVASALVAALGLLAAGVASATPVVMNFDQFNANGEYVDNYYNGGCSGSYNGGPTHCGGPNYGVAWSQAIAGGAPNGLLNNTANEPSSPNAMVFLNASAAVMNVAAGFTTGFSFYYAAPYIGGSITVWSGEDGTGTLLASLTLPTNGADCDGFTQNYSCWSPIGVTFAGTAESVNFGGTANYIVFDNVTLGSSMPGHNVPEPAALGMFGFGALLIGLFAGLRRRLA